MAVKRQTQTELPVTTEASKLELTYISLDDLASKFLDGNSKKHDIEKMKASYREYGFRDPVAIDKNLNKGKGGIVEGNGRVEALKALFDEGSQAPKNIEVKDGTWFVPVIIGGDADSEQSAIAFSIEHNLSVLWGGDFSPEEMLKLFDTEAINKQLQDLFDADIVPITFEDNRDELRELLGIDNDSEDGGFDSENEGNTKEIDTESFEFEHKCPKCGFEYND